MNWSKKLTKLGELINTKVEEERFFYDKSKVKNNWLGFPSATKEIISLKEEELGMKLPPSYKNFLKTSNGFRQISIFLGRILPIQEIGWLKEKDRAFYKILEEDFDDYEISDSIYFTYGKKQDISAFRIEYFKKSIMISDWGDGAFIVLNPAVKFGDEWEAWEYANWYGGAIRYKSFEELFKKNYKYTTNLVRKGK